MKKILFSLVVALVLPFTVLINSGCSNNTPARAQTPPPAATATPTMTVTVTPTVSVTPTATVRSIYIKGTGTYSPALMVWSLSDTSGGVTTLIAGGGVGLPYTSSLTLPVTVGRSYTLTFSYDTSVYPPSSSDILYYWVYYTDNTLILNGNVTGAVTAVASFTEY